MTGAYVRARRDDTVSGAVPAHTPMGTRIRIIARTALLLSLVAAAAAASAAGRTRATTTVLPPIHHVWLIMLENHSFPENFGAAAQQFDPGQGSPASMTYMAKTLP